MKRLRPILILSLGALFGCAKKPAMVPGPAPVIMARAPATDQEKSAWEERVRLLSLARAAFQTVYFPFDRAALTQESKDKLAAAGDLLKRDPAAFSLTIEGHADERGTEE